MHTLHLQFREEDITDTKQNAAPMAQNIYNQILMCFNAIFNNQGYYKIR